MADSITIYTPNGTEIICDTDYIELSETQKQNLEQEVAPFIDSNNIIDGPTRRYNCFSYAFYSQDYINNNCSIRPDEYLYDASYEESSGKEGDIILYCRILNGNRIIEHAGIIVSNPYNVIINGDNTNGFSDIMVVSKWGDAGLYYHDLLAYTDYLSSRGTTVDHYFCYSPRTSSEYILDDSSYETISDVTSLTALGTGANGSNVPYLMYELNVEDSGYYSFYASGSSSLDVRLYDSSMQLITDTPLFGGGSDNLLHEYLSSGKYYYRVQYINGSYGSVSITMRYNEYCEDTLMTDPASNWLCGTQITINEANDINQSYGDTFIDEGFTRIIYLDPQYAENLSRLDYYWISSDDSVASVTDFGTVLAKDVYYSENVTIYAVYIYDPSVVYQLDFSICPYYGSTINIQINLNLEIGDNEYLDIGDYLPFNYLQYYDWESTNTNVVSINSLGKYNALSTGTSTINGDYCYNERVHIIISVTVTS